MAEYWDLFDGERRPLGRLHRRGDPLPEGCYHQVVHVWIRDDAGRFLLSQRHPDKPWPLYWEATGGAVVAGENPADGARREVEEELGIRLPEEAGRLLFSERREKDFHDVWLYRWNGELSQLRLQEQEVVDARWVTYGELCRMERDGKLVPSLAYFHDWFEPEEGSSQPHES